MSDGDSPYFLREAGPDDHAVVVDYNLRLALETEGKRLDPDVLGRGVARALAEPERLRYWLAVRRWDGLVVGQTGVTREWSDWRNGWLWWLQSVYVAPEARGVGLFKSLYGRIRDEARSSPDVVGIRLYVEDENHRARETYRALGMKPGGYAVFEEVW